MATVVQQDVDREFLISRSHPKPSSVGGPTIGVVDLFSGCGGLTIGALEGARRAGRRMELDLAVDAWPAALEVLGLSLEANDRTLELDLGQLLDGRSAEALAKIRAALDGRNPQLVVAGPPCQGHSALNNHSRHDDSRNDLYLAVARAALALRPAAIVIENVRGISRDRRSSVHRCISALAEHYEVVEQALNLHSLGTPQTRTRHVLVATRERAFDFDMLPVAASRDVRWAIGDLADIDGMTIFDTASVPSPRNLDRMRWLVQRPEVFDLPNDLRPLCHQSDHSYKSMYGQLRWDLPAQTITSGFGSMGQGRFVHPEVARTLTPHEAARLQFLPDYIDFSLVEHRAALATMIGNAAPPTLTMAIVQALVEQSFL